MEGDRISASNADKAREGPCAKQREQLPALQGDDIVRIVLDPMIEAGGETARDPCEQKGRGEDCEEHVAT